MFGADLRTYRHQLGLSQEDLARRANVDVKTVRSIERGRAVPRPSTVRQLADALDLTDADRKNFCAAATPDSADPPSDTVSDQVPEAVSEAVSEPPATPPRAAPAQLPLDVRGFTGRAQHLEALDSIAAAAAEQQPTAVVITTIDGTAGIGKTALAVHWAHRVADRFGDGQLYINLRGFDPTGTPLTPVEVIRVFLDSLDVPPHRIPAGLDAQVALYRSLLAGKRMLILLDNARDVEQVRPLLPGAPGCLVLVTSRNQLTGLVATEGAHPLTLAPLTPGEAHDLLTHRLGAQRVTAEPEQAAAIAAACGRLPLALAIVAARAATQPHLPLHALADELSGTSTGLDALSTGEPATDVRAVFSWSYHALSPEAALLFRLHGLCPGPHTSIPASASLAALPVAEVRPLLAELTRANLIVEHTPGRYVLHDLLRAYAADLAHHVDPDEQRHAATHRLLDRCLHSAQTADRLLNPGRDPITVHPPQPGVTIDHPTDQRQALAWFTAERRGLMAAVRLAAANGFDTHTWQLTWVLWTFLERRGHWHDLVEAGNSAVAATRRLADPIAQARAHLVLASVYARYLGRLDDALVSLRHVLDLSSQAGDKVWQAHAHFHFSLVRERQGRHAEALDHVGQALDLFRAAGHRWGEARSLGRVGWCHALLGEHHEAVTACQESLTLSLELDDHICRAKAWNTLGYTNHHQSRHSQAVTCYQNALALFRKIGDRYNEADILTNLGDAQHAAGNPAAAYTAWQDALSILTDLDHPDAKSVHAKLVDATTISV